MVIVYGTPYDPSKFRAAEGNAFDPAKMLNTPADLDYLKRNVDVADAVKRGEFVSGYDHYLKYGKAEYDENIDPTMRFGTAGYEAVKDKWPYKRYYNLALNTPAAKKSKTTMYLFLGLLAIGAVVAYMKLKKGKKS